MRRVPLRVVLLRVVLAASILVPGLVHVAPALAADFEERVTFDANELTCANLIGTVSIEGHDRNEFAVLVRVQGDDASRERIRIESKQGTRAELNVVFPVDDETRFVYPPLGESSKTSITFSRDRGGSDSPLNTLLRKHGVRRIEVTGEGSGLELWADVTILVPKERSLTIDLGVGAIDAANVAADLELRTRSGPISARKVTGELAVETGSGEVILEGIQGRTARVNTGSGRVEARDARCEHLDVNTGSGAVVCERVSADQARLNTGSGRISLQCERLGDGTYDIDTGSGSVQLTLPEDASAVVEADTGSGEIDIDVGDVDVLSRERGSLAFRVGKGDAGIHIDTGSGSITISK